jgi:hypothetical protein
MSSGWTFEAVTTAVLVPLIGIVSGTIVTIALFRRKERLDAQHAELTRQRDAVTRLITAVSRVVQESFLLAYLSPGVSDVVTLRHIMLMYVDASPDDFVVVRWAELQIVELLTLAARYRRFPTRTRREQMAKVAGVVMAGLVMWHKGVQSREWYRQQVEKLDPDWVGPASAR